MGLDMYLYRRIYVGNGYREKKDKVKVVIPKTEKWKNTKIDIDKLTYITETIGYWRKANAIHQWFVDNVQEGNDDCKEYYVEQGKLKELLGLVNEVLAECVLEKGKINNGYSIKFGKNGEAVKEYNVVDGKTIVNPQKAEELLPTSEGFFFGSQDYDEYYIEDLKDTKKILEEALTYEDDAIYYDSSW